MTRLPRPAGDNGPYETREQARAVAEPVYAATRNLYGASAVGAMQPHNHKLLCSALTAAGVELGAYDHRVIWWCWSARDTRRYGPVRKSRRSLVSRRRCDRCRAIVAACPLGCRSEAYGQSIPNWQQSVPTNCR